jgi:hypothetical protein
VTRMDVIDERAGIYIIDDCHIHTAAATAAANGASPFGVSDGGTRAINEWLTAHRNDCRNNMICQYLHQQC